MAGAEPKFYLIDAVEHQKAHPTTFELPDKWNREHVAIGELAKLIFVFPTEPEPTFERMWVRVALVTPTSYGGVLENKPETPGFISAGHRLSFEARHIISIWPARVYFDRLTLDPHKET